MPQARGVRQDVSEHRRLSLHENQRRKKVVRPRQQHARPCSPRGPAGRRGWSAQGRCCSGGRRDPAGWDKGLQWPRLHHKRRKQSRRDLELHSCLRHTWGRLTDCRQSRPAPTAAKHRGLSYCSFMPPLRHQDGRSGREYPPRGSRMRAWSALQVRGSGLP